jgi:RNA binding exosome subunit
MKTELERRKWVEDFFSGLIPEADAQKALAEDPRLRQYVEFENLIELVAKEQDVIEFEEKLKALRTTGKENQNESHEPRVIYWVMMLAASLVIIAGAVYWVWLRPGNTDPLGSAEQFIELPIEAYRGKSDLNDTLQVLTRKGHYAEARQIMEAQCDTSDIEDVFIRGICRFNVADHQQASHDFHRVISHADNVYIVEAKYLLALSFLRMEQREDAISLLNELTQGSGPTAEKARSVLQSLN